MAFELTIDGYTFDNPPSSYRKRVALGNSPQPHYEKTATPFYRSDSQQITLTVSGRLNLNDQGDLDELEKLQEKGIQGGEVDVDFDPFFSGTGVIEDDPFEQENQRGRYEFSIAINEETTNDFAYPAHATPTTGNTFELGSFDFGFDPESVSQDYDRQTERVDRLQGVAQTSDTKGLVTRVSLEGRVDGGGQAELWDKARSNALAYLTAEFQNGWALLNTLSVEKDDATPDYLSGLFRYSAEFLIVKDPSSGIGETSQFINHDIGDSGTYTSDDDAGSGSDDGGLDFKVLGGTGSIDGRYVDWVTTTVTLSDNATNYVFVDDADQDGVGQVEYNTSGFPGSDALPLYEVDTSSGDIVDVRDVRDSLLGEGDDTQSDFIFRDEFAIDDTSFTYAQILAFADAIGDPALAQSYLGKSDFTEAISDPVDTPLEAKGFADFMDTAVVDDGGSATGGSGTSTATSTWDSASDWNGYSSQQNIAHADWGDLAGAGTLQVMWPEFDQFSNNLLAFWPLMDSGPALTDVTGNGYDLNENGNPSYDEAGLLGGTSIGFDGSGDYFGYTEGGSPAQVWDGVGDFTAIIWIKDSDVQTYENFIGERNNPDAWMLRWGQSTSPSYDDQINFEFSTENMGINDIFSSNRYADGNWHMVAGGREGSTFFLDIDGGADRNTYSGDSGDIVSEQLGIGAYATNDSEYFNGNLMLGQLYDRAVSASELSTMYGVLTGGVLTTGTKSFSEPVAPDLEGLSYSLNGQGVTLDVIGSPGTASEEIVSQVLDGASSYELTWSSSHTDFRIRVDMSISDQTKTPTFGKGVLSALVGGGADSDQNSNTTWTIDPAIHDRKGNEYEGGGVVSKYGG